MNNYKLLTPGPLTTSEAVKAEMRLDRCTWDDDYKQITQKIRSELLQIAGVTPDAYTAVLLQGSGSFGVEAVLTTAVRPADKLLIITNGAYGARMAEMAGYIGLCHTVYGTGYDSLPDMAAVRQILGSDPAITHIAMVHCETTTGILNPLAEVAALAREFGKSLIIDAMSSFGGMELDIGELGIDWLISSANKCIQGVPGFCFVVARKQCLSQCRGNARSLVLDLYEQWRQMDIDGKWRYTSPTHVVAAFARALAELAAEGGVAARSKRYSALNHLLRRRLAAIGIEAYIPEALQSPIITTFRFPNENFRFGEFYQYVKERGFVLYPGKLTDVDTFRIGNIGEIYQQDMEALCAIIEEYMRRQAG